MVDDITRGDEFHTHTHLEEMYYFIKWKAAKSIGTAMGQSAGSRHGILIEFNKQTLPDGFVVRALCSQTHLSINVH